MTLKTPDFWFRARQKPKVLSGDNTFGLTTLHWNKKTSSMRHSMIDWTLESLYRKNPPAFEAALRDSLAFLFPPLFNFR